MLIVCSYLCDVFLHSALLLGWSSFSEILVVEGYFDGQEQKITISNILSLSFGLIGLFLVVHGLIR